MGYRSTIKKQALKGRPCLLGYMKVELSLHSTKANKPRLYAGALRLRSG